MNSNSTSILDGQIKLARKISVDPTRLGVAPVSLDFFIPDEPCPVDLCLIGIKGKEDQVEVVTAATEGTIFKPAWRDSLIASGQRVVFVKIQDGPALNDYLKTKTARMIASPKATRKEKARLVREMAVTNLYFLFNSDFSPTAIKEAVKSTETTVDFVVGNSILLERLSFLLCQDYSIYCRSVNVAMLSMGFGTYLKLSSNQVRILGIGGLLHDVGMAKIPMEIRQKPSSLTRNELVYIKNHPILGFNLLNSISIVPEEVLNITLRHHENADGTGYPGMYTADKIPFVARLVKIVDVYDALTSPRQDREAMKSFDAGLLMTTDLAPQFSQDIVKQFFMFISQLGSPEEEE